MTPEQVQAIVYGLLSIGAALFSMVIKRATFQPERVTERARNGNNNNGTVARPSLSSATEQRLEKRIDTLYEEFRLMRSEFTMLNTTLSQLMLTLVQKAS